MAAKLQTLGRKCVIYGGAILCVVLGLWILKFLALIAWYLVMVAGLGGLVLLVGGLVLGGKK